MELSYSIKEMPSGVLVKVNFGKIAKDDRLMNLKIKVNFSEEKIPWCGHHSE